MGILRKISQHFRCDSLQNSATTPTRRRLNLHEQVATATELRVDPSKDFATHEKIVAKKLFSMALVTFARTPSDHQKTPKGRAASKPASQFENT